MNVAKPQGQDIDTGLIPVLDLSDVEVEDMKAEVDLNSHSAKFAIQSN